MKKKKLFGYIACQKKFITEDQLEKALMIQKKLDKEGKTHKLLGIIMIEQGLLSSEQLLEILQDLEDQQGIKHY